MKESIKKNGIKFGVILAVYLVLRTAAIYSIDLKLFVNSWFGFIDVIITIVLGIIAIAMVKKSHGGFISFNNAFSVFVIIFLIGWLSYSVFNMLLFNVIDPEAKTIVQEEVIKKTVDMLQGFGSDSAQLKETVKKMRETDSFSVQNQILGLGVSILMYCVIGLIVAAAMKKNNPYPFAQPDETNNTGSEQ